MAIGYSSVTFIIRCVCMCILLLLNSDVFVHLVMFLCFTFDTFLASSFVLLNIIINILSLPIKKKGMSQIVGDKYKSEKPLGSARVFL